MVAHYNFLINAAVLLAILWRLPLIDWAAVAFGPELPSKLLSVWHSAARPFAEWRSLSIDPNLALDQKKSPNQKFSSVQRRAEGAVLGALLGDALALQTHYEYDYKKIRDFYKITLNGTVEKLGETLRRNAEVLGIAVTPGFQGSDMKNWHPGKDGGDLTDHGDCVVMALEFLAGGNWSVSAFDSYWWFWIQSYKGYINMATKAIMQRRKAEQPGPGRLGWPPSEDLFALCRLPAILYAFREGSQGAGEACSWSQKIASVYEVYPQQLATVFSSEEDAMNYCEHLGTGLCGGVSCWLTQRKQDACALTLSGARQLPDDPSIQASIQDGATTRLLQDCPPVNHTQKLSRAAIESASIQYASAATFTIINFLSVVGHELLHGNLSTEVELRGLLKKVARSLLPHQARFIIAALDAVEKKLDEVSLKGTTWSTDPLEVDDVALRTFGYKSDRTVQSIPYPCKREECPYWEDHGKASPTVPGFVAVMYLFLRYASSPLEHTLAVNAMLGGDTATRGFLLGMLAGAAQGREAIPMRLLKQLHARPHVQELLNKL